MLAKNYDGPERRTSGADRRGAKDFISRHKWKLLTIWIILFSLTAMWMYTENRKRIDDIQQARVASCERTYEGIREVFRPFFPVDPDTGKILETATPEQVANLKTFNDTIQEKKSNCDKQTRVVRDGNRSS